jgi:hypothetical protein
LPSRATIVGEPGAEFPEFSVNGHGQISFKERSLYPPKLVELFVHRIGESGDFSVYTRIILGPES